MTAVPAALTRFSNMRLFRGQFLGRAALGTILSTLVLSGALAAPPVVIKATPDHGDTDVDPDLKEIRIEFDQDMSHGGHSVCGGGPSFPTIKGKPKWESARVFIMPVTLAPDTQYSFSINCPAAGNFKSKGGESAEVYPISFSTGAKRSTGDASGKSDAAKLSAEQNRAAIAELRKAIDERYSYRDLHKLDWDALFKKHQPDMEKAETPAAFAREAGKLLAAARDIHISLWVGEAAFASYQRKVEANVNVTTLGRLVPQWNQTNDCVYTGRFDDGVGYIMFPTWSNQCRESMEAAYRFLGELGPDAPGLIIDVRPNSGGDEVLAREFAGCFVSRKKVYSKNTIRDPGAPGGFAGPFDRIIEPNTARPGFRGKVAVLMGPANMSSCESFLLMMKEARNCKLFGAKSYGSSGNPKPAELSNGVTVLLPSWQDMFPDGTLLEGRGVDPDEKVDTTSTQLQSEDRVLRKALDWIRSR